MKITPNSKFTLAQLPKNESELKEIVDYHAQFTAKYFCIELGKSNKSQHRFRDWVCESMLGMTSGGYQQLQSIWLESEKDKQSVLNLVSRFESQLANLPDTIFIKDLMDSEGFNSLSTMEDAVSYLRRDIRENDDFESELESDFEVAILEEFHVVKMYTTYPDSEKYGIPYHASETGSLEHVDKYYTSSINRDEFEVISADNGDDGVGYIWYELKRK